MLQYNLKNPEITNHASDKTDENNSTNIPSSPDLSELPTTKPKCVCSNISMPQENNGDENTNPSTIESSIDFIENIETPIVEILSPKIAV